MITQDELSLVLEVSGAYPGATPEQFERKIAIIHKLVTDLAGHRTIETGGVNKEHLVDSIQPDEDAPADEWTAQIMLENEELKRQCFAMSCELKRYWDSNGDKFFNQQVITDAIQFVSVHKKG